MYGVTNFIEMKTCRLCQKNFRGRTDKIFCCAKCKSLYHKKLVKVTHYATYEIDKVLHRNRSILLEILGKHGRYIKVNRKMLDRKNFKYNYITSYHVNSRRKMINYVYDFSWAIFSDNEVVIRRLKDR